MIKKARDLLPGEQILLNGLPVTVESKLNQHGGMTIIHHSNGRLIRDPSTEILILDRIDDIVSEAEGIANNSEVDDA